MQATAIAAIVNVARGIALIISFCHCDVERKSGTICCVNDWEIIADISRKPVGAWAAS
jgi:hypothetical protein